jgi:hypothetical protein
MRKAGFLLMILLILVSFTHLISFAATADPDVNIIFEAATPAEVDVTPGTGGFVKVPVNITGTGIFGRYTFVRLYANCSLGRASVQHLIIFEGYGGEKKNINVSSWVKIGTSSYAIPNTTINGTWEQGSNKGNITPFTIDFIVLPFYHLSAVGDPPVREVIVGESGEFNVELNNTGNIFDTFTLNISNREELDNLDITVDPVDPISLEEDANKNINLNVRTSFNTQLGPHTIDLVFTSLGSDNLTTIQYPLILLVEFGVTPIMIDIMAFIIIIVVTIAIIVVYVNRNKSSEPPNTK